jgi:translation initiation factor IF-1
VLERITERISGTNQEPDPTVELQAEVIDVMHRCYDRVRLDSGLEAVAYKSGLFNRRSSVGDRVKVRVAVYYLTHDQVGTLARGWIVKD